MMSTTLETPSMTLPRSVAPKAGKRDATPRVGFVSLGCPKALVDSEQIVTQLRAEGYEIAPTYEGADLVVVNTCGFIDAAVEESLDAIGEALAANGGSSSPAAWARSKAATSFVRRTRGCWR